MTVKQLKTVQVVKFETQLQNSLICRPKMAFKSCNTSHPVYKLNEILLHSGCLNLRNGADCFGMRISCAVYLRGLLLSNVWIKRIEAICVQKLEEKTSYTHTICLQHPSDTIIPPPSKQQSRLHVSISTEFVAGSLYL